MKISINYSNDNKFEIVIGDQKYSWNSEEFHQFAKQIYILETYTIGHIGGLSITSPELRMEVSDEN